MAVTLRPLVVPFVSYATGDRVSTSAIDLDGGEGDPWGVALRWLPAVGVWVATVAAADGTAVVADAPAREGESLTSNLTGLRPAGDLAIITRDRREPGRDSFRTGHARLLYFREGLDAVVADAAGDMVESTLPST